MFKPAQHVDREHFPALVEDIGEDPARFLDNSEDGSKRELILARIRGIERLQVLNAWLAVERRLNGGRRVVVDAIEERRAYLEEHGERELQGLSHEELQALSEVDDDQDDDVEPTWRHERCGGIDVERESSRTWYCSECEQRTNRVEAVDDAEPELVADGGSKVSVSERPDEFLAIRLPESDVYHISKGEGPVCRMDEGDKFNDENAQVATINEAEKFFDRCKTCSSTFHEDLGLTTGEIRGEIRHAIGLDWRDGTVFDSDELVKIHDAVVGDGRALHTDSSREGSE